MTEITSHSLVDIAEEMIFHDAQEFVAFLASGRFPSSRWVFRGQSNNAWPLQSTLERFASAMTSPELQPFQPYVTSSIESYNVSEFRRRARHYTTVVPEDGNLLEWLALMRHHGSPSRLLDFSKSPYVAAFFATAEAARNDTVAIWALDARALKRRSAKMLSLELCSDYAVVGRKCLDDPSFPLTEPQTFRSLIGGIGDHALVKRAGPIPRVVFAIEPYAMNERMLLQQGLFLFPTSLECSFQESLRNVLARRWEETQGDQADSDGPGPVFCKLVLQPSAHPHVLRELHRMGLNYSVLTPGLDGLGRSLATASKIHVSCSPFGYVPNSDLDTRWE